MQKNEISGNQLTVRAQTWIEKLWQGYTNPPKGGVSLNSV